MLATRLPLHHLRRSRRAPTRGAAMAEGVVAITTMLVFLGLIVWVRQAYGMKLDLQQQTRSDTFYYASSGCTDKGGGNSGKGGGGMVPIDAPIGKVTERSPEADIDRSWNSARGAASDTASWYAVWDRNANGGKASTIRLAKGGLTSNVGAETALACNEPEYRSQATAWFKFGLDFARSGAGLADLFN